MRMIGILAFLGTFINCQSPPKMEDSLQELQSKNEQDTSCYDYPSFIGQDLQTVTSNSDWNILDIEEGDLNNDSIEDLVLILESTDSVLERRWKSSPPSMNKARIILVFFTSENRRLVEIQNNHFIARTDKGGMLNYLVPDISIENSELLIEYQYTRSHLSYHFKHLNNDLVISEAKFAGGSGGQFELHHYDFIKMNLHIEQERGEFNELEIENYSISVEPKRLSEFDRMWEWEIQENCFL